MKSLNDIGVRLVASRPRLASGVVHQAGSPSLFELYEHADVWHTDAYAAITQFVKSDEERHALVAEARAATDAITETGSSRSARYPDFYSVERETSLFLYSAIRLFRPDVVVETGVADGRSSATMLAALEVNGHGELHSVDISHDVGTLVSDRERWHLHVVSESKWAGDLRKLVADLGTIGAFFHDANHDYSHQLFEYETFWPAVRPGGLFMSDDIDLSYAFLDFVRSVKVQPTMLLDRRKVFGVVVP